VITIDFNRLPIVAGSRILDVGCGEGRHTGEAVRFENVFVIGTDIEYDHVIKTRNRLKLHETLGSIRGLWGLAVSDIHCLPFPDRSFDIVICSEVLEHVKNPNRAIKELSRVLKPQKVLGISVPRYLPERICWALSDRYHLTHNGHVRIYKKEKLVSLLEYHRFKLLGCHYAHSLHSPYWWLKCALGLSSDNCSLLKGYHRLLVWDIMKRPWITQFVDRLLNPVLGKSIALYFQKN